MEEKVMKVCPKCGRELPLEMFNKCAKNRDGLQSHCKECHSLYQKVAYEKKRAMMKKEANVSASIHKVYAHTELAKFTPRQLMEELKARGFKWEYILEPQRKIMFEKI